MVDIATIILNNIHSLLSNTITLPSGFHGEVNAVKEMLVDDVSGMVDTLTDFQVNVACVDYKIETNNSNLTDLLDNWLDNIINRDYEGQIPRGIHNVAKEYFQERWKGSSFPILKIAKWDYISGLWLPTKMFFVDGGSIYSEEKEEDTVQSLLPYNYYLGRDKAKSGKLYKNVIITKPFNRPFDEYPTPYLVKRGVYHNWAMIQMLKSKQSKLSESVIPYMLRLKMGSEALELQGHTNKSGDFKQVADDIKKMVKDTDNASNLKSNVPLRVTNWDEFLEHLIPDLTKMFDPKIYTSLEKHIMAGLGFIDIMDIASNSRKESSINPKAFMSQTITGVKDFKIQILKELMHRIVDKNKSKHKKYMSDNLWWKITSSPIIGFMTDEFKQSLRLLWKNGQLSNQTYCELVGEVEYATEVARREREMKAGHERKMYPHITENKEDKGLDIQEPTDKETDKNGKPIPTDKKDDTDKYKISSKLESENAIYPTLQSLPDNIKKKYNKKQQEQWREIWNNAYQYMMKKSKNAKKAESYAFRVANGIMKKRYKKFK